jgi:MFS family permease
MTEADRRFRKNLVAAAMVAGPLLILIGIVISSSVYSGDDEARYLASIREHKDAFWIGNVISATGALLLPLVFLGLAHLVRVRKRIFGTVAGVIGCIGAFGIGGAWLFGSLMEYQMAMQPQRAAMVALEKNIENDAFAPLFFIWVGFMLGLVLMAIGLLLARTVPRWTAILLAVAIVAFFVSNGGITEIIANVLLTVAFSAIAWTIWKRTPDEFEAGEMPADMRPAASDRSPAPAAA